MTEPDPAAAPGASPTRRQATVWATAGLAVLAGAGWAWQSRRSDAGDSSAALWQQSFDKPDGTPLDLAGLRGGQGRLVVNFWATWCPPCVAELPMLDRFHQEHAARGWQVLGLAVDTPSSVRKFLAGRPVGFPVGMAGLQGTDLSRALGNAQGGLPFTVVLDPNGRVLHRKIGQLSESDLSHWL
ncbi:redoxin family protein [Xylophilus rhododendri]|uniref:Redoxin family protein n=1 Tax=Xylophilus rhododendri TaxID=2697032 RepID=A0A857J759_9BURK|nr:TlpA disulfide reductase family protein [Xylophilus rhododendri]QHI99814.1 redoxin family protein [Xylophilus rhododendri]